MQPFHLICPGCKKSLRVRSEGLIGQIVPCPGCGIKVTVKRPEQLLVQPPTNAMVDSGTITREATDAWPIASKSSTSDLSKSTDSESDVAAIRFRDEDDFPVFTNVPEKELSRGNRTPSRRDTPLPIKDPVRKEAASTAHAKTVARQYRQVLLVTSLGLGGLLVAAALFLMFLQFAKKPGGREANPVATANKILTRPAASQPENGAMIRGSSTSAVDNHSATMDSSRVGSTGQIQESPVAQSLSDSSPMVESPLVAHQTVESSPITKEADSSLSLPNGFQNSTPVPGTVATAPAVQSPTTVVGKDAVEKRVKQSSIFDSIANIFDRKDDSFLHDSGGTPIPLNDQKEPLVDKVEVGDSFHQRPAAPVKTQLLLDAPLGGIQIVNAPLMQVLKSLSQLSAIGISLNVESMSAALINPEVPVSFESQTAVTRRAVLESVLSQVGLNMVVDENGLILVIADNQAIAKRLPIDPWSVEDLRAAGISNVSDLIKQMYPVEFSSLSINDDQIIWQPTTLPLVKFRVFSLLEKLRQGLHLPSSVTYQSPAFQVGWPEGDIRAFQQGKAREEVTERGPITQLLTTAALQTGFVLLIDWPAVWQHGFTPSEVDLSYLKGRSLQQVARKYLEWYSMDLVHLGGNQIMLTTPEQRRMQSCVLVMPLPSGTSIESLTDSLRIVAPMDADRNSLLLVLPVQGHPLAVVRVCLPKIQQLDLLPR